MWIYLLNYISIPIYNLILKDKKKFVILVSIQMFLILALRSETLGVDLGNYSLYYTVYQNYTFIEMLKSMRLFGRANVTYGLESGYVLFNWIIGKLGFSFHSYLVICAFICMLSIGIFIYRYSENPALSFAMFLAFNGYEYLFGILRQSLGLALFLFAIPALKERKKWQYFILTFSASLFHTVFWFAIPLYFFSAKKIKSVHYISIACLSILIAVGTPFIYENYILYIFAFLGKSYSLNFQWNNMFLLVVLLLVFFYIAGRNSYDNAILWGFFMALPVQALGFYISVFSRAAIGIFLCFAYILIANAVEIQKHLKYRILYSSLIYICGIALYAYSLKGNVIVPYISILDKYKT